MSDRTHIEWADATWNPIRALRRDGQPNKAGGGWACQRISPGCVNCYAATINRRLGTGLDYDARGIAASDIYLDEQALTQPLRWRKPRRIFVCSMTDLFGEWVPDEMIDRVFAVMALSPRHTFQVLTKRPERMREYLSEEPFGAAERVWGKWDNIVDHAFAPEWPGWPLPNVWVGVSAEDQRRADERIPELLATPAAVRFLSCEPLLGRLDLAGLCGCDINPGVHIDWVIVGGESGPGARPCDVEWIRGIVRQCQVAGVAVFVKQLGRRPYTSRDPGTLQEWRMAVRLRDRAGGDPSEWPEDLRVREFPEARDE